MGENDSPIKHPIKPFWELDICTFNFKILCPLTKCWLSERKLFPCCCCPELHYLKMRVDTALPCMQAAVSPYSIVHMYYAGLSEPEVPGVPWPPQVLAEHLNLSQPVGQIMPNTLLRATPPPPRFSDLPTALICIM